MWALLAAVLLQDIIDELDEAAGIPDPDAAVAALQALLDKVCTH